MSHKDAPPETADQIAMREFYTAMLNKRGVVVGWGRDAAGNYLSIYARDAMAAWLAAKAIGEKGG